MHIVWVRDPPIFVYRMRLWIRVRLVGVLLRRSLSSICSSILRSKMRESILVALRASRIARGISDWRCCLKRRAVHTVNSACLRRRAHILNSVWISRNTRTYKNKKENENRCGERCAAGRAPGCAPRLLRYYSHSRGAPTRALVGGRPIASPRNVLGHGQRLSRVAAAAGPPLHRLTLNSTHRTQSQNTAPDATHGHGLLRLGHRHLA